MITSNLTADTLTLQLPKAFSIHHFPEIQQSYRHKTFQKIEIDCSNLTHIDSGGLGILLHLKTHLKLTEQDIHLTQIPQKILAEFQALHFDTLFTISTQHTP